MDSNQTSTSLKEYTNETDALAAASTVVTSLSAELDDSTWLPSTRIRAASLERRGGEALPIYPGFTERTYSPNKALLLHEPVLSVTHISPSCQRTHQTK